MTKFLIEPHFRLQEWVAEEKGYFRSAGLDYEFKELIRSSGGAHHVTTGNSGAFQSIEKGRHAQRDIDLRPELYTHYYPEEFPERFHAAMDTRRWGPGERIVFEPYSKEVFEQSFEWIAERGIFEEGSMGTGDYEKSVISLAAPIGA
jgi:hypothetical protein